MKDKVNKENKKEKQIKQKETGDIIQKLKECQKQRDEYLAGWQRVQADFLNYKKQEAERLKEMTKYVNIGIVLKILPILDNFDLAEKNLSKELKDDKNVFGILQIKTQILDFLKSQNIEEIKAVGEKFDPNFHEAIEQVEIKNGESGIVAEEIQKGYKLNGRVIRPAKVRVIK